MIRLKQQSTVRSRVLRHFLNALAIILTLELCSRAFVSERTELVVRNPEVGRTFLKNIDRNIWNHESEKLVRVRTNSYGFRSREPVVPKPHDLKRVIVLGDSFISALQVESEQTLCARLEQFLNESSSHQQWEVLNFGITGSGTADQHIRYLKTLRRLQPDVILVGFGMGTDPVDNHPRLSNSPLVHYDLNKAGKLELLARSEVSAKTANLLNEYCRFYLWQKGVTNRGIKGVRAEAGWFDKRDRIYLDPPPEEIEFSWNLTAEIIRQFQADVKSEGTDFWLVTIPSSREIYDDQMRELIQKGREAGLTEDFDQDLPLTKIRAICQRHEVSLIEIEPVFRRFAPAKDSTLEDERLFFKGHGHMNERGNRLAARTIADRLLDSSHRSRPAPSSSGPPVRFASKSKPLSLE